jgi:hypothetical protein
LLGGCSRQPHTPTGVATWAEINTLAEAFVLRGKSDGFRQHCNTAAVPAIALQKATLALTEWKGVPENLKHVNTQVLSLVEYEALQRDDKKDLPTEMRDELLSKIKWNVNPEKIIVFTFANKDPTDTTTQVRWSAGAYRTNGLWFFATSYSQ